MAYESSARGMNVPESVGRDLHQESPTDPYGHAFHYQHGTMPYSANGMNQAGMHYGNHQQHPAFNMHDMAAALPMNNHNHSAGQGYAFAQQLGPHYQQSYAYAPFGRAYKDVPAHQYRPNHDMQRSAPQWHTSYGVPGPHYAGHPMAQFPSNFPVNGSVPSGGNGFHGQQAQVPSIGSLPGSMGQMPPYGGRSGSIASTGARATFAPSEAHAGIRYVPPGPPRKPKQNGHALWVGNLPLNATVVDLKDHFSRGATNDILSLKLMARSNCAFVNYKDGPACAAAMKRFMGSRFHGSALVCRLRKTPNNEEPSAPLPQIMNKTAEVLDRQSPVPARQGDESTSTTPSSSKDSGKTYDVFFVLKSLTLEDLLASTHRGTWTTQPHNEAALNKAFDSAENVYLIFSVNKSGEYFGFARMMSRITPGPEASDPTTQTNSSDLDARQSIQGTGVDPAVQDGSMSLAPRILPTPPTETAPAGYIVDDLARGTIFWEVKSEGEEVGSEAATEGSAEAEGEDLPASSPETHRPADEPTRSFQVQWLSVSRVPFYRTRGLRNAFNDGKDVKIARDGTRIEPEVGARLLELLGRSQGRISALPN